LLHGGRPTAILASHQLSANLSAYPVTSELFGANARTSTINEL
jgi:hypothetical protein